uniref:PHTB1_N domain-containing protein n=1 Tax=Rhabditophanes sp. KR3021 TaxID=114890 RepID=A0AC35TN43_9BILA
MELNSYGIGATSDDGENLQTIMDENRTYSNDNVLEHEGLKIDKLGLTSINIKYTTPSQYEMEDVMGAIFSLNRIGSLAEVCESRELVLNPVDRTFYYSFCFQQFFQFKIQVLLYGFHEEILTFTSIIVNPQYHAENLKEIAEFKIPTCNVYDHFEKLPLVNSLPFHYEFLDKLYFSVSKSEVENSYRNDNIICGNKKNIFSNSGNIILKTTEGILMDCSPNSIYVDQSLKEIFYIDIKYILHPKYNEIFIGDLIKEGTSYKLILIAKSKFYTDIFPTDFQVQKIKGTSNPYYQVEKSLHDPEEFIYYMNFSFKIAIYFIGPIDLNLCNNYLLSIE